MKLNLIALAMLLLFISVGSAFTISDWNYKTQINVSATSAFSNVAPYQPIILNSTNINYSNIASGQYAVAYYSGGVYTQVYTYEFPTGGYAWNASGNSYIWYNATSNGTYYLVYSNKTAVNTTWIDARRVFLFYDNFDGTTLNTTHWWANSSSTATVSGGFITISDAGAGALGIVSKVSPVTNQTVLYWRYNSTKSGTAGVNTYFGFGGYDGYTAPVGNLMHHDGDTKIRYGVSSTTTTATTTWDNAVTLDDYALQRNGSGMSVWKNGVKDATFTATGGAVSTLNVTAFSSKLGNLSVDYVFTTDYITGIAYTYGAQETILFESVIIYSPTAGTTYYNGSAFLNFTIGNSKATYNVSIYVDGVLNSTVNVTNSTYSTYTIDVSDGSHTILVFDTSNASVNSSVTFINKHYILNSTLNLTDALTTQIVTYYAYIKNFTSLTSPSSLMNVTFNLNGTLYNATYYGITGSNITYFANLTMPNIGNDSDTMQINTTVYFVTNTGVRTESSNDTFDIYKIYLNNCSSPASLVSAMFLAYDEPTGAKLNNMSYDLIVNYWLNEYASVNFSHTYTDVQNATLCIYPNYSTIYANVDVAIYNASERYRTNYIVNGTFSNTTQYITTYTFVNTSGNTVTFSLIDAYGNPVANNYIKIQRYFTANTSWIDVTTLRTNGVGGASTYLIPYDVAYRFLIYNDNTLVRSYDPIYITQSTYQFTTATTTAVDYTYYMNVGVGCTWNNATKVFSCTATDPSGLMTLGRLVVRETKLFGATDLCNANATGSAVTITCDLSTYSNITSGFSYAFYTTINNREYLRQSGIFSTPAPTTNAYGNIGVLYTAIIVLALFLAGIWNVGLAVILAYAGLVFSTMIGFISLTVPTLLGLGAVVLIIAYKLRS